MENVLTSSPEYRVLLPQFEGPFDLLLFFIERDEIDVRDIPIAKITHDFITYLHQMQKLQIEIASEFILMAARLMKIKAALLLPRPQLNEKGEIIDPREELVDRLIEYKKYKDAMERLQVLEALSEQYAPRGYAEAEAATFTGTPEDELIGLTVYRLFTVYKNAMQKFERQNVKPKHVIRQFPYTMEEVRKDILKTVNKNKRVDFHYFIKLNPDRLFIVFCFLNILELIQQKYLSITVAEGYNNFWITPVVLLEN